MKWSYFHRYRKYRKRLNRRWDDRVALLKWNYHFKLYGPHGQLWGVPVPAPRKK